MMFRDREEAGRLLAQALAEYQGRANLVVLGLPRGGVPIAQIVADSLAAPMDVLLVRKLGVPWQPELAFGAIAETPGEPVRMLDASLVAECALNPATIEEIMAHEQRELERRGRLYRGSRSFTKLGGREVILVDDGLATGFTMLAAVRALRQQNAGRVVVAVPIGSRSACRTLRKEADELVCISSPEHFESVGSWYKDFSQVTDAEVQQALSAASGS
jgi:predicted phosphoribosyltransferase